REEAKEQEEEEKILSQILGARKTDHPDNQHSSADFPKIIEAIQKERRRKEKDQEAQIGSDKEIMNLKPSNIEKACQYNPEIDRKCKSILLLALGKEGDGRVKAWRDLEKEDDEELRKIMKDAIALSSVDSNTEPWTANLLKRI